MFDEEDSQPPGPQTGPSVLEKGLMAADIGSRVADELRSLKQPPGQQLVPEEDTRTKNAVVWDQKAMDRATKPVVLEGGLPPRSKADGGFVDKSLYN